MFYQDANNYVEFVQIGRAVTIIETVNGVSTQVESTQVNSLTDFYNQESSFTARLGRFGGYPYSMHSEIWGYLSADATLDNLQFVKIGFTQDTYARISGDKITFS